MTGKSGKTGMGRGGWRGRPARRIGRRRRSGQMLVLALLAISLMVGLIFFVYNTGRFINRRVTMQNVADSVAISGAGWIARSMNVIAMNNCGQSRVISLVPIFDSLPVATEIALKEITVWEDGLADQLQRGVPATKTDYLRRGLENLRQTMATQRDILAELDQAINGGSFDMRTVTYWSVDGVGGKRPHGSLWRTAKALEEFSQVTYENSDVLAQANAVPQGILSLLG